MKRFIVTVICILTIMTSTIEGYYEAPVDITGMSITQLQEAVDDGLLTYELIVRLYLDRISAYDSSYSSLITINEKAIEEARLLDEEYKTSGRRSMIHGIPIIVKDNIDVVGMPTTVGSKALLDSFPYEDATVVKNLKDKGAIILAKANMSQYAFSASDSASNFGTVKNAYNTSYTTYGSSGGSAASVALSFAPVSLGTDTNSSIRLPASASALVGMRGTFGLLDMDGILPYDYTRDVVGPITNNVRDNAIILDIMAGGDGSKYLNAGTSEETIRIGVLKQSYASSYSGIVSLLNGKLELLSNNGIEIVYIDSFYNSNTRSYHQNTVCGYSLCNEFNSYIQGTSSAIKSFRDLYNAGSHVNAIGSYLEECGWNTSNLIEKHAATRKTYQDYVKSTLSSYQIDLILYPANENRLSVLGESNLNNNTQLISPASGLPALNVPMGFDDNGLPYGMDLLSTNEEILYKVAMILEGLDPEYKVPGSAPSLYSVPSIVTELISFKNDTDLDPEIMYSKDSLENYNASVIQMHDFVANYNDYENKEESATRIVDEYITAKNNLRELNMFEKILIIVIDNILWVILSIVGILVLIVLLAYIRKVIRRKRRRNKKRRRKRVS